MQKRWETVAVCAWVLVLSACGSDAKPSDSTTTQVLLPTAGIGGLSTAGTSGGSVAVGNAGASAGTEAITDGGTNGDAAAPNEETPVKTCPSELPRVQAFEEARAAHGKALFRNMTLTPGLLPEMVLRNLWVAWNTLPPASDAEYWAQARARYGLVEAPYDNGGLPLGMRREANGIAFDCMLCHAGRVGGITLLGAANGLVDLETLYDDLLRMRELAPSLGLPQPPVPFDLDGLTYSVGEQDAFGLGFRVTGPAASGVNTEFGPQKPPAWWLLQYKTGLYVDGSGDASGHRSMMATLVAFGITPDQLAARDEDFVDIAHYLRSQEPPCWTFSTLDAPKVARGRTVFDTECAGCHGVHSGDEAAYPNLVSTTQDVGTDPIRAERFGSAEATRLNATWFGSPPFQPTGGYLAQPLAGVWARAPYFHNGSVPDLASVLDPAQRPKIWKRKGTELADYDVERVGVRYDVLDTAPAADTREGRQVYDTTREGMSNAGHTYGSTLDESERSDLLEYLRSL